MIENAVKSIQELNQVAEFIQPHAGGIKNRDGKIGFWVVKRLQEMSHQIYCAVR